MLRLIKKNNNPTPFDRPKNMPPVLHQLLVERGIGDAEAAERFLRPDASSLHDPMLLSDMADAVARIRQAMEAGESICVYGDYDVDGVCASAILWMWLKKKGANAKVYLPSRHTEGYGLNEAAIREIAGWATLMVTVDCGVTSVELVALAKSLGLSVVVTDHHRPAETLPDCPVVNPLLNDYPFPYLCGAGVAWKLVWALSGEMPKDCLDIAAIATVADVVSLTGENRVIVSMGLQRINKRPRTGIAALIEVAGLTGKPVTSTAVAFQLAPRLNAGGRLDTALRPLELITTRNAKRAQALAEELDGENTERREIEQRILQEAEAQLQNYDFIRHRALILSGKDWNPGVIGLAASRLVEKYHYPVVMLADQGDRLTGSCRSIEGVDIHAALTGCAHTILRYGGHRQAAGLTLEPDKLQAFIDAMDAWLGENVSPEVYIPMQTYDTVLDLEAVSKELVAVLERLQPTGFGNPAPVFFAHAEVLDARAVGINGAHLKLTLAQDEHRVACIAFREGERAADLCNAPGPVDALFVPKLNSYMGRVSAQLEVRALTEPDSKLRIASKLEEEFSYQCDFLTEILYNKKIDPSEAAAPETLDEATLRAWFEASPQGTLAVTADLASAKKLVDMLSSAAYAPDLYFEAFPKDPRAFNAICVCPYSGSLPASYRRIALCGVPSAWLSEDVHAGRFDIEPGWIHQLPDLEVMRSVYRALVELSRRPFIFNSSKQLAYMASINSGIDMVGAYTSIAAIVDMGLFKVEMTPTPRIIQLDRKKADPEESAIWRALQRWRIGNLD